jgi:hypothetical protein
MRELEKEGAEDERGRESLATEKRFALDGLFL